MSFRDLERGPKAGHALSKQPWQGHDSEDASYERAIKSNIQEMQESVRDAGERLRRGLLSRRSVEGLDQCLAKSRGLVEETEQAFRDWTVHLASEPTEKHRKKFSYEKLRRAFEQEVARLKEVAQQIVVKQHEARVAEQQKKATESRRLSEEQRMRDEEYVEERALLDEEGIQEQSMNEASLAIQNRAIREREEGMRRIQGQVCEVNQIVKDLASICQEQGQHLGTIEQNVEESATHTRQAVVQLKAAAERQSSTNNRLCCFLFVGLLVLSFVLLPHLHLLSRSNQVHVEGAEGITQPVGLVLSESPLFSDEGVLTSPWGFGTGFGEGTKVVTIGHSFSLLQRKVKHTRHEQ